MLDFFNSGDFSNGAGGFIPGPCGVASALGLQGGMAGWSSALDCRRPPRQPVGGGRFFQGGVGRFYPKGGALVFFRVASGRFRFFLFFFSNFFPARRFFLAWFRCACCFKGIFSLEISVYINIYKK